MHLREPIGPVESFAPASAGWRAELSLDYERHGPRTVLARRRHEGPLVVQKPLYPEGDAVCHTIVVHPPAGIVGGDHLAIDVRMAEGGHALLTTPGAGKWYRSAGAWAQQRLKIAAGPNACVEWLPQETIVFDGALAELRTEVDLDAGARFIGWEILCLGRSGSGERFMRGECRLHTEIRRAGRPLWYEHGRLAGGGALLASETGLRGQPVSATLLAAGAVDDAGLAACRAQAPIAGAGAVTRLPGLLVARYAGPSSEAARNYFMQLWTILRPLITGRTAARPRIWNT
jgi:urease accessory protein